MTKELTIRELTVSCILLGWIPVYPEKLILSREKRKTNSDKDKGKEKVPRYKKRTSQKRLHVVQDNIPSKKLRTSDKISPCCIIYAPAKLFWKFSPIIKYNKNLGISHKEKEKVHTIFKIATEALSPMAVFSKQLTITIYTSASITGLINSCSGRAVNWAIRIV